MSDAKIYVAGIAATNKDIQEGMVYDLLISALAALALILLIMMFITRSIVAAIVIVGTVALSLGASVGLSVLLWQYIFGIELFWIVVPLAIILLLAVGADYNLLLISRFDEEITAGLRTGIIRAMAGTGRVVTAAGSGVRRDDVVVHLQRPGGARSDRHHDRSRSVVRHARRAVVHDARDRRAAGSLVLVAAQRPAAAGQPDVPPVRDPHRCPGTAESRRCAPKASENALDTATASAIRRMSGGDDGPAHRFGGGLATAEPALEGVEQRVAGLLGVDQVVEAEMAGGAERGVHLRLA